ncbi:phosphatidylserine decarboxylase family protein [Flavobacteriaceae bacterium]|jgi:phosphatidylserine decarboxylase|nr:phosphatidylserine decarboxylase family protein [Flavobacteriaceae bacterium]MDA9342366.1 phosphatidylserine decarboxylase family protein [Flavobacteriaceae bacterium]MDB4127496.1 phosphatidylserine decarboxylase family protein [Flavobacteriaceae bacterium]MDB9912732.1 phosphatidylserine decarboxylase family protein [Flavobacteriaceae bacterium]MDB9994040.1 phosphatidylserine decarboxylase family protein [Flavobacteriaceae bacterium]|tara:strand:- start:2433 stop:3089 length:657 start_codon:yes stop_codon:yes gene_type:complete
MFHKEGFKIITTVFLISAILAVSAHFLIDNEYLEKGVLLIILIVLFLILQFFRNPKRDFKLNTNQILSAVDGKVVVIEEVFEKEYFKDKRLQISVFMSPLNVHVTRYPISGSVVYNKYHPGKFLVAWHPKSSEENERTSVVVKSLKFGEIMHRQIAGAVAKRIVNYAEEGQEIFQTSDSGFIKFGSRVDIFLPLGTKINVKLNQKVKGGITVLANNDN